VTETCADDFATIWVACRICAASVRARCPKPQPTKTVYARGSMEWLTEQKKSAEPQCRLRRRLPFAATSGRGPTTKLAVAGGPRVRIHFPPAKSRANSGTHGSSPFDYRSAVTANSIVLTNELLLPKNWDDLAAEGGISETEPAEAET
jgi:hypothetical protein